MHFEEKFLEQAIKRVIFLSDRAYPAVHPLQAGWFLKSQEANVLKALTYLHLKRNWVSSP